MEARPIAQGFPASADRLGVSQSDLLHPGREGMPLHDPRVPEAPVGTTPDAYAWAFCGRRQSTKHLKTEWP